MAKKTYPRKQIDPKTTPFDVMLLAMKGMPVTKIAKQLGISTTALRKNQSLKYALERGEVEYINIEKNSKKLKKLTEEGSISNFILERLPQELRPVWDEIQEASSMDDPDVIVDAITKDLGKRARQQLFLQSLIHNCYSVSKACRQIGIARPLFNMWCNSDPDFAALLKEVQQHKKDFVEQSLMHRIATGDTQATIFASKTLNRDRGYNEKIEVDLNHTSASLGIQLSDLDLSLECRKEIWEALQKKKSETAATIEGSVVQKLLTKGDDDGEEI